MNSLLPKFKKYCTAKTKKNKIKTNLNLKYSLKKIIMSHLKFE